MDKVRIKIKSFIELFLDVLFPSSCIGCNTRNEILCDSCINRLQITNRQTEDNIIALYDYRDPVIKKAIWKIKYHNSPYLGQKFGELLYYSFLEEINNIHLFSQGSPIYVIPVPISNDRKRHRGYNQSEIIAKSFCNKSDKNILELKTNIIFKKANTIPQAKLTNRNKRLRNIKDAFEIKNNQQIKGKTIIIVDDVTTTGGTILEIMKVLKKNGAKKIFGFAIAH